MSSLARLFLAPVLLAGLAGGAHAAVIPMGGASIQVSATVLSSCAVSADANDARVSCSADITPAVSHGTIGSLENPTADEAAAGADAHAVTVTY